MFARPLHSAMQSLPARILESGEISAICKLTQEPRVSSQAASKTPVSLIPFFRLHVLLWNNGDYTHQVETAIRNY